MKIIFMDQGWEDYLYWQSTNRKHLYKINRIIKEISRTPYSGIGKPEALKHELKGWWSRRIDSEHRIIYRVDNGDIVIAQCRYHY